MSKPTQPPHALPVRVAWSLFAVILVVVLAVRAAGEEVRLDFPETVPLQAVVAYVAATLELNIIYEEQQLNRPVSLRVANPVPKESLEGLLRTVLRSRGLALVPAEQADWLKIVTADQLAGEGGPLRHDLPPPGPADTQIVTYVLPVEHVEPETLRTALAPYLSKPGGTVLVAPQSRLLVITDYAGQVRRAVEMAALLDVSPAALRVERISIVHQDPAELARAVMQILTEAEGRDGRAAGEKPLNLLPDPLGGGLVAIGLPAQIDRAREWITRFDQPSQRSTLLYQPRYITAARLRGLIEQMLPTTGVKLATDEPSNTLVATAPAEVHARIEGLLAQFDAAPPESATPLRFYQLLNRRADDVFATIGALLVGELPGARGAVDGEVRATASGESHAARPMGGAGSPAASVIQIPPQPLETRTAPVETGRPAAAAIQGEGYSISVDEHTNSIIALATPEMHRQIEQLIQELDRRRPQVLVEVTLVSVSVDDSLDLGVELQTQKLGQPWSFELFSSFGLSEVDPTTGTRSLNVLPGGTGVLLAPDEVPLIIQALATSGKTHVYSAPRLLVDDNASGSLESVAESPFTSVNASNTVATTSFAGFAKAGTQLTLEPHIAEGDHVEINYTLTVSSFTGTGTQAAPPPRSSDTITSTIRVPDSHTVIVGGLLTETLGESSSHVPWIGKVPVLGLLFGTNSQSKSKVRLYAFIRPTILRHERFEDLKYLSQEDIKAAGLPGDYPPDRWQYMH